MIFKNLKLDHSSDSVSPVQDFDAGPQRTPDHGSESNVSVDEGFSDISALSIEPVLVTTSPAAERDHPPTRPGGHRMHDIPEDVREESDEDVDEATPTTEPVSSSPAPRETIQGLCILTGGLLYRVSSPPLRLVRSCSRSRRLVCLCRLCHSTNRLKSLLRHIRGGGVMRHQIQASEAYDIAGGERGPGNPLFPTNFARLALGPTLATKNPALRSRDADFPRQPAFSNPRVIREGVVRGQRSKPSWADPMKHEYAITVAVLESRFFGKFFFIVSFAGTEPRTWSPTRNLVPL